MIITIVGGGSTFTPGIVKSIAKKEKELDLTEIRLYDIDRTRQDKIAVLIDWILKEDLKSNIKLTVTYDKKEAYENTSFVFAQMRVGRYELREQDEKIPLRHGCVGQETCGAGGLAYGLRTINPMIEMIDDVEKYAANDYWILNYSNPAAIVSEACRKLRPDARIINVCDMPIAIIDMIAKCLNISDISEIDYDYFGLNHFGWFTGLRHKGQDILVELKQYIKENKTLFPKVYLDAIRKYEEETQNRHASSDWLHTWESVYEMLEYFPDYLPNTYMNYYLFPDNVVSHSNVEHTRANEVMETREKTLFECIDNYLETGEIDEKAFYAGEHGNWICDLAIALKNDTKEKFLVIVENRGAIPNMPYDAMV
ncbi:MAG: 6-phospho-alpha-glucosidase, partial [Erysipelotrichaceae bacterium]